MANILIDTSVFLDILLKQPQAKACSASIARHLRAGDRCLVTAKALTDIYYIVRKAVRSKDIASEAVRTITGLCSIADVQSGDIYRGFELGMRDFEDAVAAAVAERYHAVILTSDQKDFAVGPVLTEVPTE